MKVNRKILLVASVAMYGVTQPALAQVSAETADNGNLIEDIIVTAQKRAQSINDVGMSITAASGDALINRGVTSTADLVKVTPGFNYTPSPYQQPVYVLRGVGLYESGLASFPAVTVYQDQIPFATPLMTEVSPIDLERVEVLYGPQGTLFGQNSTGGAVNYVTAKPTSTLQAGVNASYERYGKIDVNGFVSGPLSSQLNARLALGAIQGGAWQKSATRPNDRLGDTRSYQARLTLDWKPTERMTIELGASGFRNKSDTVAHQLTALIPVVVANVNPAFLQQQIAPNNPRYADWPTGVSLRANDPFYQLSARIDYELTSDITLTSLTSYQHIKQDKTQELGGVSVGASILSTINTPGTVRALGHLSSINQEVRLQGNTGPAIWTAGVMFDSVKTYDSLLYS